MISYKPRSAIRDVGKALGLGLEQIESLVAAVAAALDAPSAYLAAPWGRMISGLRDFKAIRILNRAVEVGLVMGVTAKIGPTG